MGRKKARNIIVITVLFLLGIILSSFNIKMDKGPVLEVTETIESYSFLLAIALILGFLCSLTYKKRGKYLKLMSGLTLFAGTVVIALRCINGNIKFDLSSVGLYCSTVLGEYFSFLKEKYINPNSISGSPIKRLFKKENGTDIEYYERTTLPASSHDPIVDYSQLYKNRTSQCELVISIIKDIKYIREGYSICISGEWGSGKTSFIKAVLSKLQKEEIPYSEIRINALELESVSTLIEYYFSSLKNILDEKGAYSGFRSEYKELVNSLLKLASNDSVANYVTNKLYSHNDYRKSIDDLKDLIKDVVKDERIIIIVDDIDRCSDKKAVEVLFFIKEIATMSNCISFYLVDYHKFKEMKTIYDFGEGFLDKFFNRVVSLNTADYSEIINNFGDDKFSENINSVIEFYQNKVDYIKNKTNTKEDADNLKNAEKKLRDLKQQFSNPRKFIKAYEHYVILNKVLSEISRSVERERLDKYLKKIEHHKQLTLISLLYGFNPEAYTYLECDSFRKMISIKPQENIFCDVLINEWNSLGRARFSEEKREFAELIVSDSEKIKNIIDPYDTTFARYIDYIDNSDKISLLDRKIDLKDYIKTLYQYSREIDLDKYIRKVFEQYQTRISFDEALSACLSPDIRFYNNSFTMTIFYEFFCKEISSIKDINACQMLFNERKLNVISALNQIYVHYYLIYKSHNNTVDKLRHIADDIMLDKKVRENMEILTDKISVVLNMRHEITKNDSVKAMLKMLDICDKRLEKKYGDLTEYEDVQIIRKKSERAVREMEALAKIEEFIFELKANDTENEKNSLSFYDRLKRLSDSINSEKEYYDNSNEIFNIANLLLKTNVGAKTSEILELLNTIITNIAKYDSNDAFLLRCIYFDLMWSIEISRKTEPDTQNSDQHE
ncbi:P-loop NTPase fold protein [Ruminococcus flavefaciens]|uniref:KAP-like P-loop domain-containing protein n=1 Tax=Ruminococcus flavefaciens TaxID=1265 RepID=A0A315XYD3_RUMFL|nr:P-loop NTPase fold protein [Ruminococcus flavefaciens]PWJ12196.1 KAP-like P-loop domain-containing protein [Ruminococcus flavefaciens]SSA49686.1 KAP family P-loop domain-containing protein [Ruminococcus flavefaciens]